MLWGVADNKYINQTQKNSSIAVGIYARRGGGGGLTGSTLLMNMIISWTQSNITMCAYALIDDGTQLILACNHSIMPGY